MNTPDRGQSKTLILLTNVDKKALETEFLIDICRPTGDKWRSKTGDKWQSKTLFLAIFYPRLWIVKSVFDSGLSSVMMSGRKWENYRTSLEYSDTWWQVSLQNMASFIDISGDSECIGANFIDISCDRNMSSFNDISSDCNVANFIGISGDCNLAMLH